MKGYDDDDGEGGEEESMGEHVTITPPSAIKSKYQSNTEKEMRKFSSEILELTKGVRHQRGEVRSSLLAFLRLPEEVNRVEQEINELQSHVSTHGIIVQDLMNGISNELESWTKFCNEETNREKEIENSELDELFNNADTDETMEIILMNIDIFLAEHKTEEALSLFGEGEKKSKEWSNLIEYKLELMKRKDTIIDQFVLICEQPCVTDSELRKSLWGLLKLGRDSLAHQLLLKVYSSRLEKKIDSFLSSCSIYSRTYTSTLSQLVFSTILAAIAEYNSLFGDWKNYENQLMEWAESEIERFVLLVKEYSPLPETVDALCSYSVCIQSSLAYCAILESEGVKLSDFVIFLLIPYFGEVIDLNFKRARKKVLDLARLDDFMNLYPPFVSHDFANAIPTIILTNSGKKFISILKDILDQLTPMAIIHFGSTVLNKTYQLFDKYIEILMKALPSSSEHDRLIKESTQFRATREAQQLVLLHSAFTIAEELLPNTLSKILSVKTESKESENGSENSLDYRNLRRHIQHSLDKLIDHLCTHFVSKFIYSREGKARLGASMYLEFNGESLSPDFEPMPSLQFQALFTRLQQLQSVASNVLLGKEKLQRTVLSRLIETVVTWISNEQKFWDSIERDSVQLHPIELQQLILDMHFIVEIAIFGGYSSRNIHQLVSAVITRAIGVFSARGVNPQSALHEDEWFSYTAKTAIKKLVLSIQGSESIEQDENLDLNNEFSDLDKSSSSLSIGESVDSLASANTVSGDSSVYFTDPEG